LVYECRRRKNCKDWISRNTAKRDTIGKRLREIGLIDVVGPGVRVKIAEKDLQIP
jgi:hypothetical protein